MSQIRDCNKCEEAGYCWAETVGRNLDKEFTAEVKEKIEQLGADWPRAVILDLIAAITDPRCIDSDVEDIIIGVFTTGLLAGKGASISKLALKKNYARESAKNRFSDLN